MVKYYFDKTYTLKTNPFTREGYLFTGWNTEADGSGTSYEDEATVSNLTSTDGDTVTLYAQWEGTTSTISITKISSENSYPLEGVEFSLFRQICEDDHDDDLIDVTEYDISCWELFGTYETDEDGIFTLSELPISGTYRLVEIKTVDNYLLPTGQWKIEFDYDDNLDEDEAITVDGTTLQITAISNPPALSLVDDELYLYNTPSYDLPTTGIFGTEDSSKIGLVMTVMGIIIIAIITRNHKKVYISSKKIGRLRETVHYAKRIMEGRK